MALSGGVAAGRVSDFPVALSDGMQSTVHLVLHKSHSPSRSSRMNWKSTSWARTLSRLRSSLFKLHQSQIPVIEQAIETAAMMLGSDKPRGYCLEMTCADFLAGANLDQGNPETLLKSSPPQVPAGRAAASISDRLALGDRMISSQPKRPRIRLDSEAYNQLCRHVLQRDGWRCQACGSRTNLEVHHIQLRSQSGDDAEENLMTLCSECHDQIHCG
jgi:HNH endonuclease